MTHSDTPTICRRPGERVDAYNERKRAARHRLKMADMALCARVNRRRVLTSEAAARQIVERQQ